MVVTTPKKPAFLWLTPLHLHGDQHRAPGCAFPTRFLRSGACLENRVCLEHNPSPPALDKGWFLKALSGQLCFA